MKPLFTPGNNIAIKVPAHEYEATLAFYRDILGFVQIKLNIDDDSESARFQFGDKQLWIDKIKGLSQAEIWLEVITDNVDAASRYLHEQQCIRRDEIEPLPEGLEGFRVSSPSNIIHLINSADHIN